MKNIKLYLIELILFISIIVFNFVYNSTLILNIFIIVLAIIMFLVFGLYKNKSYLNGNVIRIILMCILSFFIVIYTVGLFTGFNKTVVSVNSYYLGRIILLNFAVIVAEEIIRYIIAKKSIDSVIPLVIFTILMCILNIIIEINGLDFEERELVFIFISVVALPVISRELLCSYLTYKVGYLPSIVFKSIIVLYEFIIPIIPSLGNYLYSVFNVLLVYIIYMLSSKTIMYAEKSNKYVKKASYIVVYLPILAVLSIIIILVSGILRYKLVAIGSNSMKPIYFRGDAIIYEKVKNIDDLKVGDIIAFKKSDIILTHRISIINKTGNGYYIKTKGDNNNAVDYFDLNGSEILGKVEYKIKYIGYPTIWINEFFRRGEISSD